MSKKLVWMGSSLEDLRALPDPVKLSVGHALREAQEGGKSTNAKPFRGTGFGASVLEIVENFDTNTYRCVYTVKFDEAIYVLHSFQKKSNQGIKTPQREIDIINTRFKQAQELHQQWIEAQREDELNAKSESRKRKN